MSRANKRDTELRAMLEGIGSELAVIRTNLPITRLRVQQARVRAGLDGLLNPALDEMDEVGKAVTEIGRQVTAALDRLENG